VGGGGGGGQVWHSMWERDSRRLPLTIVAKLFSKHTVETYIRVRIHELTAESDLKTNPAGLPALAASRRPKMPCE
jgi:hypothetical protein